MAIKGVDLMSHCSETRKLSVNGFLTHELFTLEGQHRLVREKVHKVLARTEGLVEVVYELGSDLGEV